MSSSQSADVASLKTLYDQWNAQTVPPSWPGNSKLPSSVVLAGDWNGFNKGDPTAPWKLTRITAPATTGTPDAFNWHKNTVHVAANGGDTAPGVHSFVVVGDNSYSNQWGGVTIKIDSTSSLPFYSGNAFGPTNSISLEDGFYYSFRIIEPLYSVLSNVTIAVMKTSGPPIAVDRSAQQPAAPTSNDPINVSIVTNQSKSPEERIFLRWSTDFFITSHVVEASGSGLNYSATIPPQPAGSAVFYSILTSTVDLSQYSSSGAIDAMALATTGSFKVMPAAPSQPTADLQITLSDGKKAVVAGSNDTYTVVASNSGPGDVAGATVRDAFPAALTGVSFTATQTGGASGFSASGNGNITDTVTIPAGSSITYKATGKLSSAATGTISNTASATAPSGVTDSNLANNTATDTDAIHVQANLKVTVNDGKTAAVAGQRDTYTITVTNFGPSDATGVTVSDTFPDTFTGVTFTATQTGGASGFSATGSGNINDTVTMPAGAKIIYKAKGTISPSASGTISDTATVTPPPSGVTDPILANNSANDTDTLQ